MATYAIGDVQGCSSALFELLDTIDFDTKNDTLWFAGDLVNRGDDNVGVLRYIKSLGDRAIVVLGNHDLHLLAAAYTSRKISCKDTIEDVLEAHDRDELLSWLRQQRLFYANKSFAMSHAGIPPTWTIKQAKARAKEVTQVLRSDQYVQFLERMYGNQPSAWHDDLQSWERLRVITNYFTRMRFCDNHGHLDLDAKEGLNTAPQTYQPWFSLRQKQLNKKRTILFGHWAALEGYTGDKSYQALDTGCVWGGSLSALCLETMQRTSINCQQRL